MMLQALPVKLEIKDGERALLLSTMRKYNEAANWLAEQAFHLKLANKIELQKGSTTNCESNSTFQHSLQSVS